MSSKEIESTFLQPDYRLKVIGQGATMIKQNKSDQYYIKAKPDT